MAADPFPDPDTAFARTDRRWIVLGIVLLLIAVVVAWQRELTPEWEDAQAQVHAIVAERLGAEAAAELPTGLRQIWLEPLGRTDRCVTCHTTIEYGEKLRDAPHPARSHPPGILEAHPVERFGCTLCHGGQGHATTKEAAHGNVDFWEEPLLDSRRAKLYGIERAELMELRCATCHQTMDEVVGMPLLNAAKEQAIDCLDCHKLPGLENETPKGPDLTREGEKHPSTYHFPKDYSGERSALAWHVEHFLDPKRMTPGSSMPKFDLDRKGATALSLLVLSWKRMAMPPAWTPKTDSE